MSMMKTYQNIIVRANDEGHKSVIQNEEFEVMEECANTYHAEHIAKIPAGTKIIADFAGDFGIYAVAEIRGALHKIKIEMHELHKINFGRFEARQL